MSLVRLLCVAGLLLTFGSLALAAPTAEQRAEIAAINTLMTKAGNLFKDGKFKECADVIKDAQPRLEKLAEKADEQTLLQLLPIHKKLVNAHALLELEGVTLPELKPLATKPADKPAEPGAPGAAGGISFVKQVAPILNSRCGNCHVRGSRGMFSMSSYEVLMKGPAAGKVVFAGNVPGSDLVVKVEDKEMPPNGAGIPDAELATLKKWIEEGAKFDGPDPAALLTALTAGQPGAAPMPVATVVQATGKETISFSRDIAPVLVKSCVGCHGQNRPSNDFTVFTFENLLKGGERGEPILPGKPADSLLIKKLKGTADGDRMPRRQPPLDDATIAKFEKWIEEGAKFDAPNAKQSTIEVAAIAKAKSQTHDQLSADRAILAEENWRLGMPGITANRAESTNFIVLGDVGENTLKEIAERAEAQAPKVGTILKSPPDQALVKGRVTLFVFRERYDYGEFGKMVEKRDLPTAWRGHYKFSIVDAYGAVLTPKAGEYSLDALIAQQLAAVAVASRGKGVPHWFAEGTGRVVASRTATGADSRVDRWDEELPRVLSEMKAADDFLTNKLPPEDADIAAYSFVKFLMADAKRYQALLDALRKDAAFDAAFASTYGGTPAQAATAWARNPPKASTKKGVKAKS
ncbi:MAG: c-type cytochrome domain-containing protein [Pirellulaceae bacterium]|nr:c-type cytochrome domain-containing protein [Pirellulaceae bacterium]